MGRPSRIPYHQKSAMKILLPVDGSHVTKRMLSYIAAHDELLGRQHEYTLIHVIAAVPAFAAEFLEHKALEDYYLEQAELVFHPIRGFADQQGWPVRLVHAPGQPAEVIAAMADGEHFDLIVMGTHGHSSLGNVVLGSVATGVLARSKTPVLLIR
jgi:nucleotide-binding universal stress UspA family protein